MRALVQHIENEYAAVGAVHERGRICPAFAPVGLTLSLPIVAVGALDDHRVGPRHARIGAAFQREVMRCLVIARADACFRKSEDRAAPRRDESINEVHSHPVFSILPHGRFLPQRLRPQRRHSNDNDAKEEGEKGKPGIEWSLHGFVSRGGRNAFDQMGRRAFDEICVVVSCVDHAQG